MWLYGLYYRSFLKDNGWCSVSGIYFLLWWGDSVECKVKIKRCKYWGVVMKFNFLKGLILVIVIEEGMKDVLMLVYMNEEVYKKMLEMKRIWFYFCLR